MKMIEKEGRRFVRADLKMMAQKKEEEQKPASEPVEKEEILPELMSKSELTTKPKKVHSAFTPKQRRVPKTPV